jgi:solute carrier family 6 (neurotransmitter transporter, glycine) member 5/9
MEILLGQFSSKGCIKVYDIAPAARGIHRRFDCHIFNLKIFVGIGIGQCICCLIVMQIYVSVMALTIRYFVVSFNDPLPWSQCKAEWNESCIDSSLKGGNFTGTNVKSSAELYFL